MRALIPPERLLDPARLPLTGVALACALILLLYAWGRATTGPAARRRCRWARAREPGLPVGLRAWRCRRCGAVACNAAGRQAPAECWRNQIPPMS